MNVIELFNGAIPLVALKMTAYRVGDQTALTFVKVLDEMAYGLVGDDEPVSEITDRSDWETKASTKTLQATDELLKLVRQTEPHASLRYTKHYIGLEVNGAARNFVTFRPRKAHIIMEFKLPPQDDASKAKLEEASIGVLAYDAQFGNYRIRLDTTFNDKQRDVLLDLIRRAWEGFRKA